MDRPPSITPVSPTARWSSAAVSWRAWLAAAVVLAAVVPTAAAVGREVGSTLVPAPPAVAAPEVAP